MAIATNPEEAALLLNCLEDFGLKGAKLACSRGNEAVLARQLAEQVGIVHRPWQVAFIEAQVKAAEEMADLESRVDGGGLTPCRQRILDASYVASAKKPSSPQTWSPGEECSIEVPDRALRALAGKYRPSTLKRYLGYWQHYRRWCFASADAAKCSTVAGLVDYLYMREEEGMGPSISLAVTKSVSWFQALAGVPEGDRLVGQQLVELTVKELMRKLESKAPP